MKNRGTICRAAGCTQKKRSPKAPPAVYLLLLRQLFDAEHMPENEPDKTFSVKYDNLHMCLLPSEKHAQQRMIAMPSATMMTAAIKSMSPVGQTQERTIPRPNETAHRQRRRRSLKQLFAQHLGLFKTGTPIP